MNIENINKVIDAIRQDGGAHLYMSHFVSKAHSASSFSPPECTERYKSCNTAFCIGGWANALRLDEQNQDWRTDGEFLPVDIKSCEGAAEWLGLKPEDSEELFYMDSLEHGSLHLFDQQPPYVRAAIVIDVLEKLRDDGVVDWVSAIKANTPDLAARLNYRHSGAPINMD